MSARSAARELAYTGGLDTLLEARLADWMRRGSLNRGTSDKEAEEASEEEEEEEEAADGASDAAAPAPAPAAEDEVAAPALTNFMGVCMVRCCFDAASWSPERESEGAS